MTPAELTALILTTLLSIIPRVPQPQRGRLEARHDRIVAEATAAAAHHNVPVALLFSTAMMETHIGTDVGEGDGWGAPISRFRRHTAGTADNAASALAFGFRDCHTWLGATHHYRCGLCRCMHLLGYQAPQAIRLAEHTMQRANVPLPDHWR